MPTGIYARRIKSTESRFWAKVHKTNTCWLWTGAIIANSGYGQFRYARRSGGRVLAHRYAYELLIGLIPEGLVIDHLCRNRACVRPSHLEAVTHRENILRGEGLAAQNARKTHCTQRHPYSGDNLYVEPSGYRRCRNCMLGRRNQEVA